MNGMAGIEENESQVRSYSRAFPVVFKSALDSTIWDTENRSYLDFFSGAGGQNYGHNHPAIKQEMINYLSSNGVLHSLDMATDVKISFINTFKDIILKPRKLDYRLQFTGPTGANAVEAALKLARLKTGRSNVIAFTHSFHGVSLGALAATSNSHFREAAGVSLTNVTFLPYDNYVSDIDSSEYLKLMLEDRSSGVDMPAAIILETIQGEGGINIASSGWLRRVADIASEYGILLIVDDIQAGCGRSGDFFSFEESGIVPDIVVLSKSISGSGSPMSLLLIKPEHDIWQPAQHNGTFRGNTLAFVSARAAINTFWKNVDFSNDIKRKGNIIRNSLRDISTNNKEFGLEVRGKGMINGLVFEDESIAAQARRLAFDKGMIIELCGARDEVLKVMPPLTVNDEDLSAGMAIISDVIDELASKHSH